MTTTRYDRMRAAAAWIDDSCGEQSDIGNELRADADELEAVEREIREWDRNILTVQRYADRIRGEK